MSQCWNELEQEIEEAFEEAYRNDGRPSPDWPQSPKDQLGLNDWLTWRDMERRIVLILKSKRDCYSGLEEEFGTDEAAGSNGAAKRWKKSTRSTKFAMADHAVPSCCNGGEQADG